MLDQPGISEAARYAALAGLARLNSLSFVSIRLWAEISAWAKERSIKSIRVLDVACGGGDVLRGLATHAISQNYEFYGMGMDLSPETVKFAKDKSKKFGERIDFCEGNALDQIPNGFQIVISTLFLHHLSEANVIQLLKATSSATAGLLLAHDLVRSTTGYLLTIAATRLFSREKIVHFDGLRSVEGAFSRAELAELALQAGLQDFTLKSTWPCRMLLRWEKL